MFDPPVDGVYLLTTYALSIGADGGDMYIKNNEDILCTAYIYPAPSYIATCSTIVQLAAGDSVRVTGSSSDPASINAPYCGFAGHIISDNLTS